MTVNIVEILDLYLKNGGRRPYIIIVLNSCFIPKTFRTFPRFFPIFHRYNKNQDFLRTGNGFYEIPDFFPFSRLLGNPDLSHGYILTSHWVRNDSTWIRFDPTCVRFDSKWVRFDLGTFWLGYVLTVNHFFKALLIA